MQKILGVLSVISFFACLYIFRLYTVGQQDLAIAQAINADNQLQMARIERSVQISDEILAAWASDRAVFIDMRLVAHEAILEAFNNEAFKMWCDAPAATDTWGLLNRAGN